MYEAVTIDTRQSLDAFADCIPYAERLLRGYHSHVDATWTDNTLDAADEMAMNARLIFTKTWAKAILYSRAIIGSVNENNLLVAFSSLRGYLELIAVVRFTVVRVTAIIKELNTQGHMTIEDERKLRSHFHILLHGGRFDWELYLKEGPRAVLEHKKKAHIPKRLNRITGAVSLRKAWVLENA